MAAIPIPLSPGPVAVTGPVGPLIAMVPSGLSAPCEKRLDIQGPAAKLPVELDVSVPIRNFRVRNLLALEPGVVVESQWGHVDDLPVLSGNQPLAWSEFEVVDSHLAVRITRLS